MNEMNGSNIQDIGSEDSIETESLKSQVEYLKHRITQLEQFIQQQSMTLEQMVSRLNRIDQMQIQLDVMLRNHKHGDY